MKKEDLIIRKSFAATHNNGEIWAENLDSLYDCSDVVESKFAEDLKAIKRPSTPSAIAVNLSQTKVTKHFAEMVVQGFIDAGPRVRKVAFVGLDKEGLGNLKHAMKTHEPHFAYEYFDDFVRAKDWLV